MSWLTEIAGKAEDLLNKVDKSAATALQNKTKFGSAADIRVKTDPRVFEHFGSPLAPAVSETFNFARSSPDGTKKFRHSQAVSRKKSECDDEKLLLFLNSPDSVCGLPVNKMPEENAANKSIPLMHEPSEACNEKQGDKGNDPPFDVTQAPAEDSTERLDDFQKNDPAVNESVELKTLETKDNSVTFLQEELFSAKKQAKYAESEMKRMQRKLEHWNSQISGNDKLVRDLQDRDSDFSAALDAKDSQLAVLKVRLEEVDNELCNKKKTIADLMSENERITKTQEDDGQIYNQTIENLRSLLSQTELELSKCKEDYRASQNENLLRISKMEEEQRHMAENVTNWSRKWNEQNERNKDFSSQLQAVNRNYDSLHQEYSDYKQKAQRILQSKEKLIVSLKEGHWDGQKSSESENSFAMLTAETEGIKQEREMLREELLRANDQHESYRNEIKELEKMAHIDSSAAREHFHNLEEQLHQERLLKDEMQHSNNQFKEELAFMSENLAKTQSNLQNRIMSREMEIEKLRKQLTAKSLSTVSQDELESRLHALTENLIQKQTIVEALSTEKNSLVLQLERLEQQFKEAHLYSSQTHTVVGVSHSESERKQKPPLFLENPFDSHLTRKVKRVYGSIDALSIRMGVFFRRYPIARMFIIVYMILLHLWVMIVLLTYEPEIHSSTHQFVKTSNKK